MLQRNISRAGMLLGDSDAAKIDSIQDIINVLLDKAWEKTALAGSLINLPADDTLDDTLLDAIKFRYDSNPASMESLKQIDIQFPINRELELANYLYVTAKNVLGITATYMGQAEGLNMSGKAREILAGQSAGRLESRRAMKRAAWARIYELMFQYALAFDDETEAVYGRDENGVKATRPFSRYFFLEPDGKGGWKWPDEGEYTFSIDTDAPMANNRSLLWQNINAQFQAGMFGQPDDPETLVSYWEEMTFAGFPNAERMLERSIARRDKARQESEEAAQAAQLQQQMQMQMQLQQPYMGRPYQTVS